ncbi:MAG TPA: serine protease [Anaeromyxobacter sp.]
MQKLALGLSLLVSLSACVSTAPKKPLPVLGRPAPAAGLPPLSDKARQARLTAIVIDVPMGHPWGQQAFGTGGYCYESRTGVNTQGRFDLETSKYSDVFNAVMRRHGYPIEEELELFSGTKKRVADLQVAARVIDVTVNECYPKIDDTKLQATGNAWLKIEWSVFSTLEKKIVFTTVTQGTTYGEVASTIGQAGLIRPALQDAVERLAVDPGYRKVIDPPAAALPVTVAAATSPPARFRIRCAKEFSGGMQANVEAIRRAVVTVTANRASGSGFFVSEDGKVITAEHVVSGSRYVKVTTGAGKECYGEVVASSAKRDLALVSVDCPGVTALPLASARTGEGGEVFAVGTPLSEKLQFSVTKGVVSGVRKFDELEYIQSDVTILSGSSGGPLLDRSGNAIGVTTGGVAAGSVPVGVNFFVPLWDLERYLPIDLSR